MVSNCRHNFHEECEAYINKQINLEQHASHSYLALAAYFGRDDVALKGFAKFFQQSADEEREHVESFIEYQNLRGGRVLLQAVNRPDKQEWDSPLAAMEYALNMEKEVNQSLLDLHKLGSNHNDPHLSSMIEHKFLTEQVESIHKLATYVTDLKRVGNGLGVYEFDKELQ